MQSQTLSFSRLLLVCFSLVSFSVFGLPPHTIAKIKSIVKGSGCYTGVEIYSLNEQKIVYKHNSHTLFHPASNEKLFIAAAAMGILGFDYAFETKLATNGELEGTILNGDLFLQGSGNPALTTYDLEVLIKKLANINITRVTGNFCIDYSQYDHYAFAPGTTSDNIGESWNGAIGGLMVDRKSAVISPSNYVQFLDSQNFDNLYFDVTLFLKEICEKYGIAIDGTLIAAPTPLDAVPLAIHTSQPLQEILHPMMKNSDNIYADCIFKMLGRDGTWARASMALKEFLQGNANIDCSAIRLVDGSGLSRYNLVSPHHVVQLLLWTYNHEKKDAFINLFPVAGVDGTLKNRMVDVAGRVKAKTGTMQAISALSGYCQGNNDLYIFSIINNNYFSDSMYAPACKAMVEDEICRALIND